MAIDVDSVLWQGLTIGRGPHHFYLGENGLEGLGLGSHRTSLTDAMGGGAHGGLSVRAAARLDVDAWTDDPAAARALRATMDARPDSDDESPFAWRGLNWGDSDLCLFVRPTGHEQPADEDAVDGLAIGLRLQWVAADPTVYSYTPIVVTGATAAASHDLPFTNVGTLRSRAGRAWTLELTASGAVRSPFVQLGSQRVEWTGLAMTAGQKLIVDRHRHSYVGSKGVDGFARSGGARFLDWPTFAPGVNAMTAGCLSGAVTANLSARSTW